MSEHTGNAQPIQPKKDDTQPIKPITKKPSRIRSILIGIFGFILLIGLGGYGGYSSALGVRENAQVQIISQQLGEQYQFALVDIQFGRYAVAKQRLEFILQNDPTFPGALDTLTQVLVLSNQPTPTPTASVPPTPDFGGAESAFAKAQQLVAAQDWSNALSALDQIRKLDPTYNVSLVDGMYYFSLRNYGMALIGQGNLEGGIYQLTLAERFGPLDNTAHILHDNARIYLDAASFWELDWRRAVEAFAQLNGSGMWDGTMTDTQRFYYASMRYGDELFTDGNYCDANKQYQNAQAISNLDEIASKNANQAYQQCFPPTAVIANTAVAPTAGLPTVEVPTEVPTIEVPPPTEPPVATEPP
jgi:tetratricopeptide (TPR) repeat protein